MLFLNIVCLFIGAILTISFACLRTYVYLIKAKIRNKVFCELIFIASLVSFLCGLVFEQYALTLLITLLIIVACSLVFFALSLIIFHSLSGKKILYITTFNPLKNKNADGERIKNYLIYQSLKSEANVFLVNLHYSRLLLMPYFMLIILLNRFDDIVISKSSPGAYQILRVLNHLPHRNAKVIYLVIGAAVFVRIKEGRFKKAIYQICSQIVCETEALKKEGEDLGFLNVFVHPNFKEVFEIEINPSTTNKDVLNLVFFSRVVRQKGIFTLIDAVNELNQPQVKFKVDVFGPVDHKDKEAFFEMIHESQTITYRGIKQVGTKEDYEQLKDYDLHVLPTTYSSEGIPGSIIDFLMVGVPTLTSDFPNAASFLKNSFSYRYKFNSNSDFRLTLNSIYQHQEQLRAKKLPAQAEIKKYSTVAFTSFIRTII